MRPDILCPVHMHKMNAESKGFFGMACMEHLAMAYGDTLDFDITLVEFIARLELTSVHRVIINWIQPRNNSSACPSDREHLPETGRRVPTDRLTLACRAVLHDMYSTSFSGEILSKG